jgi:hypothetical protein
VGSSALSMSADSEICDSPIMEKRAREGSARVPTFHVSQRLYLLTNQAHALDSCTARCQAENHLSRSDRAAAALPIRVERWFAAEADPLVVVIAVLEDQEGFERTNAVARYTTKFVRPWRCDCGVGIATLRSKRRAAR